MTSTPQEHVQWTASGSDATARRTYDSVKAALSSLENVRQLDIFLQGSYANHTNIRDDSDVDVVVMTRLVFEGDPARLGTTGRIAYDLLPAASYSASALREEVTRALVSYYGPSYVVPRNKCITVRKRAGYVDADIVPCIEYRHFDYLASATSRYVQGIKIYPRDGGSIVNFPKEHISNGETKNALCSDRYKKTVRQVKRLRNRAIDERRLSDGDAPGYLLECLVSNVPNDRFVFNDSERLRSVILWLVTSQKQGFMSCDGIHTLFGSDPGHFTVGRADAICQALWGAL